MFILTNLDVPPASGDPNEDFDKAMNDFYGDTEESIFKKSTELYDHSERHKVHILFYFLCINTNFIYS